MRDVALIAALLFFPPLASAQVPPSPEILARIGGVKLWDDEGNLGTGVSVSGGAGVRLPHGVGVEAVFERHENHRHFDSGVKFDSAAIGIVGRLAKYFGTSRARPYAGGGLGVTRIKTMSEFPDQCGLANNNQFQCLGTRTGGRTTTSPTVSGFAGLRIAVARSAFVRPEFEVSRLGEHLRIGGAVAAGLRW